MPGLRQPAGELNGRPSLDATGEYAGWLSSGNHPTELVVVELATGRTDRHRVPLAGRCRSFHWSKSPGVGLAVVDADGAEDCQLYRVRPGEGRWQPVAGPHARQVRVVAQSELRPREIVVSLLDGTAEQAEYRRIDLVTGAGQTLLRDRGFAAVYFDHQLRPRLFETVDELGSRLIFDGDPDHGRLFLRIEHRDGMCVRFVDFTADGRSVHFVMPDGEQGVRLVRLPLTGGPAAAATLCRADKADFTELFFDGADLQLAQVEGERTECRPFDAAAAAV
ncbi:MAG TPA: hypothetical protein VFU36_04765, partial [Jatrophihabitans sp.]|nr:hypothetical protein [Jatrophihabitans sp.]